MKTFKCKLTYSAAAILFVNIVMTIIISYVASTNIILKNFKRAQFEELRSYDSHTLDALNHLDKQLQLFSSDMKIKELLNSYINASSSYDKLESISNIRKTLSYNPYLTNELLNLSIIGENMIINGTTDNTFNTNLNLSKPEISDLLIESYRNDEAKIFDATLVKYSSPSDKLMLAGIVNPYLVFSDMLHNLVVLDSEDKIIYHNIQSKKVSLDYIKEYSMNLRSSNPVCKKADNQTLLFTFPSSSGELSYIYIVDYSNILNQFTNSLYMLSSIGLLLFIVFYLFLIHHTARIVNPLSDLDRTVSRIDSFTHYKLLNKFVKKNIKNDTLKYQIIKYYSLAIIPSIILSCIAAVLFSNIINQHLVDSYTQILRTTKNNIEYNLESKQLFVRNLSFTPEIQGYLMSHSCKQETKSKSMEKTTSSTELSDFIIKLDLYTKEIRYIHLKNTNYESVYSTSTIYKENFNTNTKEILDNNFIYKKWRYSPKNGISFIWRVKSIGRTETPHKGLLSTIGFVQTGFSNILSYIPNIQYGYIHLRDKDANIVATSMGQSPPIYHESEITKDIPVYFNSPIKGHIARTRDNIILFDTINDTDWILQIVVPRKVIFKSISNILLINLCSMIIMIFLVYLTSRFYSGYLASPIEKLQEYASEINLNNIRTSSTITIKRSSNEITVLAESFSKMLERLDTLNKEIEEQRLKELYMEKRKNEAQLVALQTQINPHFLYNIFSAIKMLIKMKRHEEAIKMITSTGNLFRIGTFRGKSIIPMEEEIKHVKIYIEVQKLRYRNRIHSNWKYNENILEYKIPKFILQPLIENSIEHGIVDDCVITVMIEIHADEHFLNIKVIDDGKGIPHEKLLEIREHLKLNTQDRHLGLANVNERIQLHFGKEYSLEIDGVENQGTIVTVKLPKIPLEGDLYE